MRKSMIVKLWTVFCLILGLAISPLVQLKAQAREASATVSGTVMSGTTSELLLLSTREGKMEIKLDSETDTSSCKILLPGNKVFVSVAHGNDGYLHAVRITSGGQVTAAGIDSSTTATITGTINEKTKGDVLYVDTPQGEMQIKLDTTTDMSGCNVLVTDKTYSIICARGTDAYMHALSISDAAQGAGVTGSRPDLTPAPAGTVTAATSSVSGTVGDKTKEDLLYLSTAGGEMQIVIDSNTDSRYGMVLVPDRKVTVSFYNGSDAYLHAASITSEKLSVQAPTVDRGSATNVTGTVGDKSTENILYFDTPQGQMEIKLDTLESVTGCKVLVTGRKYIVNCVYGSDAYMHALSITG